MNKDTEIVMVNVDELTNADYNPRKITEKALQKLKNSLRDFGMPQPIIGNKDSGLVVGGHQRLRAAKEMGWEQVPVIYMELSHDEERALNIALNNGELTGDWDAEALAKVLQSITDKAMLDATGFDSRKIDQLIKDYADVDEDEMGEPIYPLTPKFLESYDYVVIITRHSTEWMNLKTMLGIEDKASYKNSKIGEGRVIEFEQFRQRMEGARALTYGTQGDQPHKFQHAHLMEEKWLCGVCGQVEDAEIHQNVPAGAAGDEPLYAPEVQDA